MSGAQFFDKFGHRLADMPDSLSPLLYVWTNDVVLTEIFHRRTYFQKTCPSL